MRPGERRAKSRRTGLPPWFWYGGLGMYLLIPAVLLWLASLLEWFGLAVWAVVLMVGFAQAGEVFFRIVVTLPLVQTVFALRRRDLTRAQRAVPCTFNIAATLLWWSLLLSEPFPFD